jgi:hypothetical protein
LRLLQHLLSWPLGVAQVGKKNRSVGATLMNQDSSRSHSVFTVTVECVEQGADAVRGRSEAACCLAA